MSQFDDDNVSSYVPVNDDTIGSYAPVAADYDTVAVPRKKAAKNIDCWIVQDTSGSMVDQRAAVAGGITEIVTELKNLYAQPCAFHARVSITTFSSHDSIHVGELVPIHDVPTFGAKDLVCSGSTAMWDTVASVIAKMKVESNDNSAVMKVFSDGADNDSHEATRSIIAQRIASLKITNPTHAILFIGSDPMSFATSTDIGLTRHQSIQHGTDATPSAYSACAHAIARCASGDTPSTEFNDDDILLSEGPQPHHSSGNHSYDVVGSCDPSWMEPPSDDTPPSLCRARSSR